MGPDFRLQQGPSRFYRKEKKKKEVLSMILTFAFLFSYGF